MEWTFPHSHSIKLPNRGVGEISLKNPCHSITFPPPKQAVSIWMWLIHSYFMLRRCIIMFCVLIADAGKSTTGGQILFLSGQVDDRTIQKYEKEAKDKSRESW